MPFDDQSSRGCASKFWSTAASAVYEHLTAASHCPPVENEAAVEHQARLDGPAWFDYHKRIEEGIPSEKNTSVLSEHTTAVPFETAPSTSGWNVPDSLKRFYSKPKGRDLEAGPESDCKDKETALKEEEERQTPEDIV